MKLNELRARLREDAVQRCACCKFTSDQLRDHWATGEYCAKCRRDCYDVLAGRFEHGFSARMDTLDADARRLIDACRCIACGALRDFEKDERTGIHHIFPCACGHIDVVVKGRAF